MNDLIRLEDAVEVVRGFVKYIEELPRAGTENFVWDEWCTDCKEYNHEKHCCPRFNRVIQEAVEEVKEAQQTERKTGQWIRNDNGTYTCSLCQSWIPEEQHYYAQYCLCCGAKMIEGGDAK